MFRSRSWFGGGLWKPKNPHSLEHLKYLYNVLSKNQTVSENNRGLLVETLRSIAEILIWGDQNDSSVFDFFLEKNMLSFFLRIMKQKCGSYVCVQLLQTLNILFENIRNETSLYYLLSNNHVNSIIVHKFDFSDEEVMAYYISFLKTLSLKLNAHTIHFFYNEVNEHTNDFPLYTEAIKFFNHSEGMVRIAVRTLTLNVYRVEDASMLVFIRDRTAAPYFSNLVWFIGNHIIELDTCVRNDADHQSQNRLSDLVAEHLDHLHYLNDILCLNISDLNKVLSEHLLHKLLVPLYVYSLTKHKTLLCQNQDERKHVSVVVALFLLSQVFLIVSHGPLVHTLAAVILLSDLETIQTGASKVLEMYGDITSNKPIAFSPPKESLEKSLENLSESLSMSDDLCEEEYNLEERKLDNTVNRRISEDTYPSTSFDTASIGDTPVVMSSEQLDITIPNEDIEEMKYLNVTDEEKEQRLALSNKPFLETILNSLFCTENDYAALFALCLLYALANNQGIDRKTLDPILSNSQNSTTSLYNEILMDRLIHIITLSCQTNAKVRLVTLELAIKLLTQLVMSDGQTVLKDSHLAAIEAAKEQSTSLLKNFYKSEDIFLDMFEDEYSEIQKRPLNVEWLMMDSNVLLPPTGTPMTGIEFTKRLPCGEVERARRAIRVFFLIRELSLTLSMEAETQLPLTNPANCVQVDHVLDLNNSDLIACTVVWKDGQKIRRFLVIHVLQLIIVEPDTSKLGWGVAKLVGFLQDIEVAGDKDDSRCLHLTIYKPLSSTTGNRVPLLSTKFIFDDHIRCMAAKQRLTKGRIKARQKKMNQIARLLDIPTSMPHSSTPPPNYALRGLRHERFVGRGQRQKEPRPMFVVNRVPGFAAQMRRESNATPSAGFASSTPKRSDNNSTEKSQENGLRSRDNSPKMPRPRSEEIPLEDMRIRKATLTSTGLSISHVCPEKKEGPVSTCSTNGEPSTVIRKHSEETSFTCPKEVKPRRKGQVETV
ncbi:C-type lectin domain containing ema isoform X4 [Nomia melanderi]|uniref:C-type lectin domain containing ema isoform X4 n=1 Tax=Nomia melanderi TaxID=2448451 RepID=UPI0013041F73|nr:protein CLEC16A homolog isoform X1 [Nomia melanderi]XP_031832895.1 protein CLEC16A homolog isoform X1 [Nomia melanderi]XP_031832896.1 protein CLEC16A homolog isoform X1 [Nomia melanderi]